MEEEDGNATTPFWLQSRRDNTYIRRTSSLGGSSTTVAIQAFFAGAATILIVFFIIPPFFTPVSQFLRPNWVCNSWDYLNFGLVLFAVICGFLGRNDDESNHNKDVINGYSFDKFSSSPSVIDHGRVATPRYWTGDQFPEGVDGGRKEVHVARPSSSLLYPPSAPPYPLSPPPSKPAKRRTKRVHQDDPAKEEKKESGDSVAATSPETRSKEEKKKGGETKDFLNAIRIKKKKERQQNIDGLDLLFGFDYSPPPPPFFSKKGKSKRTKSNPPCRSFESRASTAKIHKVPPEATQFINTGSESPLMPFPQPPPPPPFNMRAWKYVKLGDYVRMASNISISSDETDDDQSVDGKTAGSMFCPSLDVDTKADDFIARFRAGLMLEKLNSVKRGRSNLGPKPAPAESES